MVFVKKHYCFYNPFALWLASPALVIRTETFIPDQSETSIKNVFHTHLFQLVINTKKCYVHIFMFFIPDHLCLVV